MSKKSQHTVTFIKRCTAFTAFAVLFYALAVVFWVSVTPADYAPNVFYRIALGGHSFSRFKEVKKTRDVDLLFLGSSHAYRGFDTRIFRNAGFDVFNLGSSSQTPLQTQVLITRYYDRLNPKIVIWEIDPYAVTGDGVESAIDLVSNDKNDKLSLIMAFKTAHPKVLNTLIYAGFHDLFNLNADLVEEPVKYGDLYVEGGYVQKELARFKHTSQPPETIDFNERMMRILEEEVGNIQSTGIPIFLVRTPITRAFYDSYTNNDEFNRRMSEIAPYTDFNGVVALDDSLHFYDKHHLNQEGVEIFNEAVLEWVEREMRAVNSEQ